MQVEISIWRDANNPYRSLGIELVQFGTPEAWRERVRADLCRFVRLMNKPKFFSGELIVEDVNAILSYFNTPHFGFSLRRKDSREDLKGDPALANIWLSSALFFHARQIKEDAEIKNWVANVFSQRYQVVYDAEEIQKKYFDSWKADPIDFSPSYNFQEIKRIFSEKKWLRENRHFLPKNDARSK